MSSPCERGDVSADSHEAAEARKGFGLASIVIGLPSPEPGSRALPAFGWPCRAGESGALGTRLGSTSRDLAWVPLTRLGNGFR